ncbi:universal stress protein [Candidatus Sulfidibacterium hydrothermale]|uniref:universal stress protein n=1 Tax=Candidatus Sulfidibacterium hydrothermale TaxID=2875962 RepID=UPI001F0A5EFA|nr:universal stress protein [Candidatus Sulfidibacterium hydrothermale]UBM62002.1 universal stress protein [Candidatus Sulfidibacterium hydrothermale]
MKTILIPVDFSEGSLHSCRYALKLIENESVKIHLFHIYNDQVILPDAGMPENMESDVFFNSDIIEALRKQAELQLNELKKEVENIIRSNGQQVKVETLLQGGDPRWEITEVCEELKPDLVIMGTRGLGKKGFLEGSMASKIMGKAPVPVLAVPENYTGFSFRNIMYPTHFNKLDIHALEQVFILFNHLDFQIHVCHFHLKKQDEEADILMAELEKAFEKEKADGKISFYLQEAQDKETALKDFAQQHQIDLIAFLPEKKHPLKYIFSSHHLRKKDFFKLELPMLALPE